MDGFTEHEESESDSESGFKFVKSNTTTDVKTWEETRVRDT